MKFLQIKGAILVILLICSNIISVKVEIKSLLKTFSKIKEETFRKTENNSQRSSTSKMFSMSMSKVQSKTLARTKGWNWKSWIYFLIGAMDQLPIVSSYSKILQALIEKDISIACDSSIYESNGYLKLDDDEAAEKVTKSGEEVIGAIYSNAVDSLVEEENKNKISMKFANTLEFDTSTQELFKKAGDDEDKKCKVLLDYLNNEDNITKVDNCITVAQESAKQADSLINQFSEDPSDLSSGEFYFKSFWTKIQNKKRKFVKCENIEKEFLACYRGEYKVYKKEFEKENKVKVSINEDGEYELTPFSGSSKKQVKQDLNTAFDYGKRGQVNSTFDILKGKISLHSFSWSKKCFNRLSDDYTLMQKNIGKMVESQKCGNTDFKKLKEEDQKSFWDMTKIGYYILKHLTKCAATFSFNILAEIVGHSLQTIISHILDALSGFAIKLIKVLWYTIKLIYYIYKAVKAEIEKDQAKNWGNVLGTVIRIVLVLVGVAKKKK